MLRIIPPKQAGAANIFHRLKDSRVHELRIDRAAAAKELTDLGIEVLSFPSLANYLAHPQVVEFLEAGKFRDRFFMAEGEPREDFLAQLSPVVGTRFARPPRVPSEEMAVKRVMQLDSEILSRQLTAAHAVYFDQYFVRVTSANLFCEPDTSARLIPPHFYEPLWAYEMARERFSLLAGCHLTDRSSHSQYEDLPFVRTSANVAQALLQDQYVEGILLALDELDGLTPARVNPELNRFRKSLQARRNYSLLRDEVASSPSIADQPALEMGYTRRKLLRSEYFDVASHRLAAEMLDVEASGGWPREVVQHNYDVNTCGGVPFGLIGARYVRNLQRALITDAWAVSLFLGHPAFESGISGRVLPELAV